MTEDSGLRRCAHRCHRPRNDADYDATLSLLFECPGVCGSLKKMTGDVARDERRLRAALQYAIVLFQGTSVSRSTCAGLTREKCRRSVVATAPILRRSASATMLASTMPMASYSAISCSMRTQSPRR